MLWGEFLSYAVGPGINIIVGAVLSVLVEYWPWFQTLKKKIQRLVFFCLALAIPLLATCAAILTGEFGAWSDWPFTWWPAIYAGFTAGAAGTIVHTRTLK